MEKPAEPTAPADASGDAHVGAAEPAADAAAAAAPSSAAEPAQDAPLVSFRITFGKATQELKRPASSTIAELKAEVEKTLSIPPAQQKLMFRGHACKNDSDTLEKVGIKNGAKILLIGSSQAEIAAAKPVPAATSSGTKLAWDAPKADEDITKQPQHQKVISQGPPEDAMPGVKGQQMPLPDELNNFNGLLNSTGSKVRLTFKPESEQLWVASATSTQKIPYSSVTKIESWVIPGQEQYSVVALSLGAGGTSRYWLYFFPSQFVAGIKIRLIGVHALL